MKQDKFQTEKKVVNVYMKKMIYSHDLNRAMEFIRCKKDIVYFAENYVKLPLSGGDEVVKLYEPQKRVLRSFLSEHYLVLLKSRQTGFSTLSQIIVAYIATFYENVVMGILSRDSSEASDFNRKVCDIISKLPEWMKPGFDPRRGGFQNAQSFKTNKGTQLWASSISPANPGAVFRGKSITILILDESAHIRNIGEAWTGIAPALSKAQRDAKRNGVPFGTVVLSTPNRTQGIGKWYFERWTQAINNPNGIWKPHRIHWKEIPLFRDDPTWYPEQCEVLENDPKKIAQELELQFVPAGGMFSEVIYSKLQFLKEKTVNTFKINESSTLWQFCNIDKKRFFLIGVDTASEFGKDYSTIEVLDYITMDQVLEFRGKLAVREFAQALKSISTMVPNNFMIIENNSYGTQICEEIYYDANNHYNIYGKWKPVILPSGSEVKKFHPGLNTNMQTRPLIMDALYRYVNENTDLIRSERLALELVSLVDKGNKVEADSGANDDLALAYAFCCYARHYLKDTIGKDVSMSDNGDGTSDFEMADNFGWMRGLNDNSVDRPMKDFKGKSLDALNKKAGAHISKNLHKFTGQVINPIEIVNGPNNSKRGMFNGLN